METIILPGFSQKNKVWAEETKSSLKEIGEVSIVYWDHWQTGSAEPGWLENETKKLINYIQDRQVNILAKSIGTAVAMGVVSQKPDSINKVILCGIPVADFTSGDEKRYEPLKYLPSDKCLCIQNESDNHGSYLEVKRFLRSINPNVNIISKPRSDHEYPYFDDFSSFLKS